MNKNHFMDKTEEPPTEPYLKQVKFLKQNPPKTLGERVDRLIHGIYIDIPPEYDHYGYEIRRNMKSILTPSDLNDSLLVPGKIENAKKARIILDYWRKELDKELKEIEVLLEEDKNTSSKVKTTYRYNKRVVMEFNPVLYNWVDKNIKFLELVMESNGEFYVKYPFYDVPSMQMREKFQELYDERQDALKKVRKYSPFRAMIY